MPHTWHDARLVEKTHYSFISIHMPHTWHDPTLECFSLWLANFNPHATYVAWLSIPPNTSSMILFQSTCHIRGMTLRGHSRSAPGHHFNPHATYVAWPPPVRQIRQAMTISIHMPHTWHDGICKIHFRSRFISIHMPHTWHDRASVRARLRSGYFNPHATYVAWPSGRACTVYAVNFNPHATYVAWQQN